MAKKSEFGKINVIDVYNSIYYGIVAVVFPAINVFFGELVPMTKDYKMLAGIFLTTFFMSLLKKQSTNSQGKIFEKEN